MCFFVSVFKKVIFHHSPSEPIWGNTCWPKVHKSCFFEKFVKNAFRSSHKTTPHKIEVSIEFLNFHLNPRKRWPVSKLDFQMVSKFWLPNGFQKLTPGFQTGFQNLVAGLFNRLSYGEVPHSTCKSNGLIIGSTRAMVTIQCANDIYFFRTFHLFHFCWPTVNMCWLNTRQRPVENVGKDVFWSICMPFERDLVNICWLFGPQMLPNWKVQDS